MTDSEGEQRGVLQPVRAGAFWAAVALPFVQLPLLATDLATELGAGVVVALLGANLLALLAGHGYRR